MSASIDEVFTYDELKNNRPSSCVPERVHLYLSDPEFQELFKMDKAAFAKLPGWKQNAQRKQLGLF